jgi:hypothetical protein
METKQVYKSICAVQLALSKDGIAKTRQGQSYKFRGIDDIYNAIAPLLAANNLCILPRMTERNHEERAAKSGGALYFVTVKAEFDLVCAIDGSMHTVATYGEAMDSSDKATNKAMSAAYKYAAFQAFAIPTEGDNDTENNTPEALPRECHSPEYVSIDQLKKLQTLAAELSIDVAAFNKYAGIKSLAELLSTDFNNAVAAMEKKRKPEVTTK